MFHLAMSFNSNSNVLFSDVFFPTQPVLSPLISKRDTSFGQFFFNLLTVDISKDTIYPHNMLYIDSIYIIYNNTLVTAQLTYRRIPNKIDDKVFKLLICLIVPSRRLRQLVRCVVILLAQVRFLKYGIMKYTLMFILLSLDSHTRCLL